MGLYDFHLGKWAIYNSSKWDKEVGNRIDIENKEYLERIEIWSDNKLCRKFK